MAPEGRDSTPRQRLFHLLPSTCPGPAPAVTVAAVDLLNRHAVSSDAAQVLQLLPARGRCSCSAHS